MGQKEWMSPSEATIKASSNDRDQVDFRKSKRRALIWLIVHDIPLHGVSLSYGLEQLLHQDGFRVAFSKRGHNCMARSLL